MSILITTVVSVFIFGLVVMIHELGHFVCAKKAGIQVNEFSIGMGPALFSRVKNGTRYSIRALPVGGYVSMEGEDEELSEDEQFIDPDLPPEAKTGLPFPKVKVWKRIVVVAAGAVVIEEVPAGAVVAGSPARIVKMKDEKTEGKTALVDALRKL